jgi:hypothetical protein
MNPVLWGRKATVQVGPLIIDGLTVRFNVQLDDSNIGKAEIAVYNLNENHRKQIEQVVNYGAPMAVILKAGYVGREQNQLFKGAVREATSVKDPPDWVTTFRTGDGDGVAQVRVNKDYPKGTSIGVMVMDAAKALQESVGVGLGNLVTAIKQGKTKDGVLTLVGTGGAIQGSAFKELKNKLRTMGLDVVVQDQELQVTPIGEPILAPATLISPGTGLIGSPQKAKVKEEAVLKVKALILPGLRPKRTVQVQSALVSGLYVIRRVQYKGDTSGNDWYAEMECVEQ